LRVSFTENDEQERARDIMGRPRREAQIDALIGAMVLGVAEAAEAASMARSTAYELLQLPEVQDRLR
jgi:hypothetical protein